MAEVTFYSSRLVSVGQFSGSIRGGEKGDIRLFLSRAFWSCNSARHIDCMCPLYCEALVGVDIVRFVRIPSNSSSPSYPEVFLKVGTFAEAEPILRALSLPTNLEIEDQETLTLSVISARRVLLWFSRGVPKLDLEGFSGKNTKAAILFFTHGKGKALNGFLSEEKWRDLAQKVGVEETGGDYAVR